MQLDHGDRFKVAAGDLHRRDSVYRRRGVRVLTPHASQPVRPFSGGDRHTLRLSIHSERTNRRKLKGANVSETEKEMQHDSSQNGSHRKGIS